MAASIAGSVLKSLKCSSITADMSDSSRKAPPSAQLLRTEKFWADLHHDPARRKDPRVHANVPVCVSHSKGAKVEARSNDLSYHGMQLWCDRSTAAKLRPKSTARERNPHCVATLQLDIDGISLRRSQPRNV